MEFQLVDEMQEARHLVVGARPLCHCQTLQEGESYQRDKGSINEASSFQGVRVRG